MKYRLKFTKLGNAVWISHLDLMETLRRAFRRSDISLKHSEGYNPHPIMSLALPLSVGQESLCELLDFETMLPADSTKDALTKLNASLPSGISASEIYIPGRKFAQIKWIAVEGKMDYNSIPDIQALSEPFRHGTLIIEKPTKRGTITLDLIAHTRNVRFSTDGISASVRAFVSAQEPTINPELLTEALGQLRPDRTAWRRLALYDANMAEFR